MMTSQDPLQLHTKLTTAGDGACSVRIKRICASFVDVAAGCRT